MLPNKIERYEDNIVFNNNDTPLNLFNWILQSREEAYNFFKKNDKFKCFLTPPNSKSHEYIVGEHKGMKYSVTVFLNMSGNLAAKFSAFSELSCEIET